jgi:hypothetical protein
MELSVTSTAPPSVRRNERTGRSAVTNGNRLHVAQIPRGHGTAWARRFKDVLAEIISDMGGKEGRSEGERQLARRAATISIECEKMEGIAAGGEPIDVERYGALTDRLGRCFQRLGLRRQQREVSWRDAWINETQAAGDAATEPTNEPASTAVAPESALEELSPAGDKLDNGDE